MTKGDLMKLVFTEEELRNVDSAIPLEWADRMREMGLQPKYICWSYNVNRIFGAPIDLAAAFLEKLTRKPEVLVPKNMEKNEVGALFSAINQVNHALGLDNEI